MYEVRTRLWNLVETALTSDNIQFHEPCERLSLVHFYGQLERLIEAAPHHILTHGVLTARQILIL